MLRIMSRFLAATLALLVAPGLLAQSAAPTDATTAKPSKKHTAKQLTTAEYGKWESLGRHVLSPGGAWLACPVRRVDGKSELCLHMLATGSTEHFEYGSGPVFSDDDKWLAFRIGVSESERERLQKQKKPVRTKLTSLEARW